MIARCCANCAHMRSMVNKDRVNKTCALTGQRLNGREYSGNCLAWRERA